MKTKYAELIDQLERVSVTEAYERALEAVVKSLEKTTPDVAALVETITELCDEIDKHEIHTAISKTNILWFKRKAREALAAHRKRVKK